MSKDNFRHIALRATQLKRKTQTCKTFEVKIKSRLLTKTQKNFLQLCFLEAKWFWNDIVRSNDVNNYDSKNKIVIRLNKDKIEFKYELITLGSSMKQSLLDEIKSNIKTLVTLKKKNKKVGRIGFCKERYSIPLKQYGTTHTIIWSSKRIKIQGCKKPFPVSGLHQIPSHYEIANARIVAKATGYFIQIVTYHNAGEEKKREKSLFKHEALGLDFGIKNTVTDSNGKILSAYIEETERLKRLQKQLFRQNKRSNNWLKTLNKIKKEYQRITNRKDDLSKKFVHKLLEENEKIVIQDDNFASWSKSKHKHHWGRKIQHGCLGRIKILLKQYPEQVIVIPRFEATTKRCHICDTMLEDGLRLEVREFVCPKCDLKMNRDEQAARMILKLGLMKNSSTKCESLSHTTVGVERPERVKTKKFVSRKPVENVVKLTFKEAGIAYESVYREDVK